MKKIFRVVIAVAAASLFLNTSLFWLFEHAHNAGIRTLFDVIWWWVVTSATVGYGDIVPLTWQGRVVAICTILTGFFIYTNLVAIIMESMHGYLDRRNRGTAQITAKGHILVCEYTALADDLIQALPQCEGFRGREIVIVSDLVSRNPYPQHHFVCGVPINPAALRLANVEHAHAIFVFANLRFVDPDVKTLHVASRARRLNPSATIFLELVDPANELLKYMTGKVVVMDSRQLLKSVMQSQGIDPSQWTWLYAADGEESGREAQNAVSAA